MIYKIDFCDFWNGFDKENNYFTNTLRNIYGKENIIISKSPDFLFFSCFGFKNLQYNCVKIFYTGENIVPDFNLCDYAIGMHEISFEDRYFRLPHFMLYQGVFKKAIQRTSLKALKDKKFCCHVISNSLGAHQRKEIIDLLSSYKMVDGGGKFNNNVGGPVKDKLKFISDYKFVVCFENSSSVGYTTEKILDGFAGGGIPIYWGNPDIAKDFNSDAFINCHNFNELKLVLDFVKYLDSNDDVYTRMVKAPIFTNEQEDFNIIQHKFEDYLKHIFEYKMKRTNGIYVSEKYIARMKFFCPWFCLYRYVERFIGYLKNLTNIKMNK